MVAARYASIQAPRNMLREHAEESAKKDKKRDKGKGKGKEREKQERRKSPRQFHRSGSPHLAATAGKLSQISDMRWED
ncbi:MAG: hypothetical protein ACRC9E_12965 [Plesiomonas shigelloides]